MNSVIYFTLGFIFAYILSGLFIGLLYCLFSGGSDDE